MVLSTISFLTGLLSAEVSASNMRKFLHFLRDRIGSKPIKLTIEANGKKLEIEASNQKELEIAIQEAQRLFDQIDQN